MNKYLDIKQLSNYLKSLDKKTFLIAFYIRRTSTSQDEWMDSLITFLNDNGFTTIGIIASGSEEYCGLENVDVCAVIPDNAVRDLRRINVFIISDLDFQTEFPQNSRILAFPHGLISVDSQRPWGVMTSQLHNLAAIDGWVAPFPISGSVAAHVQNLWSNFINPACCHRKNPLFQIIPSGYPRLAALSLALANCRQTPDSIIYAPVNNDIYPEYGDRLGKYSLKILQALLRSFPAMKIVFRPYKEDLAKPAIKNICSAFAEEKRFSLDSLPGRLHSFSTGAILVTDMSHIAQSFAFTTLRPAIFFQPWRKKNAAMQNWEGGFYAYDFASLIKKVDECLQNCAQMKSMIRENRDRVIMPPESAFSGVAAGIRDFYEGKTHPDWLAIPRNNPEKLKKDVETAKIISSRPPGAVVCAAAAASIYNPESHLLCGLALHMGAMALPDKALYYNLAQVAEQLLGKPFHPGAYKDVDPGDIRILFKNALARNPEKLKTAEIVDMCLALR